MEGTGSSSGGPLMPHVDPFAHPLAAIMAVKRVSFGVGARQSPIEPVVKQLCKTCSLLWTRASPPLTLQVGPHVAKSSMHDSLVCPIHCKALASQWCCADIYGPSEGLIGRYLQSSPSAADVQVLTKFCCFGRDMQFADGKKFVNRVLLLASTHNQHSCQSHFCTPYCMLVGTVSATHYLCGLHLEHHTRVKTTGSTCASSVSLPALQSELCATGHRQLPEEPGSGRVGPGAILLARLWS